MKKVILGALALVLTMSSCQKENVKIEKQINNTKASGMTTRFF